MSPTPLRSQEVEDAFELRLKSLIEVADLQVPKFKLAFWNGV
jgi:hypothetical protein